MRYLVLGLLFFFQAFTYAQGRLEKYEFYKNIEKGTVYEFTVNSSPPVIHKHKINSVVWQDSMNTVVLNVTDSFLERDKLDSYKYKLGVVQKDITVASLGGYPYGYGHPDSLIFFKDTLVNSGFTGIIIIDTLRDDCGTVRNSYGHNYESGWSSVNCVEGIGCFYDEWEVGRGNPIVAQTELGYYKTSLKECGNKTNFLSYELIDITQLLKDDIIIYPNPVKDKLFVSGSNSIQSYKLYNCQGKSVIHGLYSENGIDLGSLAIGTYLLEIESKGHIYMKRFTKITK